MISNSLYIYKAIINVVTLTAIAQFIDLLFVKYHEKKKSLESTKYYKICSMVVIKIFSISNPKLIRNYNIRYLNVQLFYTNNKQKQKKLVSRE